MNYWNSPAGVTTTAVVPQTLTYNWPAVMPAPASPAASGWKCPDCLVILAPTVKSHRCENEPEPTPAVTVTTEGLLCKDEPEAGDSNT